MPARSEIPRILRDEINQSKAAYQSAYTAWQALTSDLPSGSPGPDGEQRIRDASSAYRTAMRAYEDVLQEFNEFTRNGAVPDRFK